MQGQQQPAFREGAIGWMMQRRGGQGGKRGPSMHQAPVLRMRSLDGRSATRPCAVRGYLSGPLRNTRDSTGLSFSGIRHRSGATSLRRSCPLSSTQTHTSPLCTACECKDVGKQERSSGVGRGGSCWHRQSLCLSNGARRADAVAPGGQGGKGSRRQRLPMVRWSLNSCVSSCCIQCGDSPAVECQTHIGGSCKAGRAARRRL